MSLKTLISMLNYINYFVRLSTFTNTHISLHSYCHIYFRGTLWLMPEAIFEWFLVLLMLFQPTFAPVAPSTVFQLYISPAQDCNIIVIYHIQWLGSTVISFGNNCVSSAVPTRGKRRASEVSMTATGIKKGLQLLKSLLTYFPGENKA